MEFVRVVYATTGEFEDVEAEHWEALVQAMHGEQDVVHVTLIGGDRLVIRAEAIDSIALLTEAGHQQRRMHNLIFWGSEEDDGSRRQ